MTSSVVGDSGLEPPAAANPGSLADRYRAVRAASLALREGLTPEDCIVQSMDDVSPTKWHLAHTTWFFETFVLENREPGYQPFHPRFRVLYNSYYNLVGEQHPRAQRGLVSRPGLNEILEYRRHVDERMVRFLESGPAGRLTPELASIVEVGIQHEQQHQELMLMDIKHVFSVNPLRPVYRERAESAAAHVPALKWFAHEEGMHWIGHGREDFGFDNEYPRHRVWLDSFEIGSRLITCGEYLAFMQDGGYQTPELWLSDGLATLLREGWTAPLYWEKHGDRWQMMTLGGMRPVRDDEPVCHVSYYEADAFASWKGSRLPTEAEWEVVASELPQSGNFVEDGHLHPVSLLAAPPEPKAAKSSRGRAPSPDSVPAQMFGDVWEWTLSPYSPYPGFRAPEGALGEYNGKFMSNQMVLRGGACVTPRSHIRATYRNFFGPHCRWQFGGIRLARDPKTA